MNAYENKIIRSAFVTVWLASVRHGAVANRSGSYRGPRGQCGNAFLTARDAWGLGWLSELDVTGGVLLGARALKCMPRGFSCMSAGSYSFDG